MRIVHLDSGSEMRGGQWQVLHLTTELAARGHAVKLLCAGPLLDAARERGLDAEPVTPLAALRETRRAELVHVHDARSHSLAAIASPAPIVVARRVAFPVGRSPASRWKYGRAARFIAVSNFVRGILIEANIPASAIGVVYDGVVVPAEISPYPDRDPRRIVAIETDDPKKGSALLLEAAASAGLTVHFSRALWDDLPTAGLFVYLSYAEGLGSAALLAMAHGVPVVASRVGGLPEIVEDGITGLLTENESADVSAALDRVTSDRSLAAHLSAGGRSAALERYSISDMTDATVAEYRTVLR